MGRKILLCMLLFVLMMLAACSGEKDKASDNSGISEDLEKKQHATAVYSLTGLPAEDNADSRAVGVMVNNHPKARPQTGLSKADIVFEILAEGDITRFLALYQSDQPETVGPVRSAREYYFELAKGYGALYIYHGAANFVNDLIAERGIEHLDGALHDDDGILFKRDPSRKAPHNSYLQFAAVTDAAETKGYEMKQDNDPLPFADKDEKISGEPADQVKVDYGTISNNVAAYQYDETKEIYARFSDGEQTVERDTDEPVEVSNVFIIEADHKVIDEEGRRAIDLESGGDAYLIQKGKVQEVDWENKQGRIIPVRDGEPVGLIPGKTWINVVPSDPGMKQSVTIN
jgi:hypothetical protein